jgi:hypothetical protein
MIDNLIHAKGGLHNRITRRIRLAPFSLPEAIGFLTGRHIKLGLEPAAELYMAIGGDLALRDQIQHRAVHRQQVLCNRPETQDGRLSDCDPDAQGSAAHADYLQWLPA